MKNQVYIIGPRRLQNELMVCRIICKTGLECSCLADFKQIKANKIASSRQNNLVLLDCQGKADDELLTSLHSCKPLIASQLSVAFYNMKKETGCEKRALEEGVKGFFYEDDSVETLTRGVEKLLDGDLWVSRKQIVEYLLHGKDKKKKKYEPGELTRREIEILALVAKGDTNLGISSKLCVSHHTVRTHLYNIFKKIHVSNRIQASLWAKENLPLPLN